MDQAMKCPSCDKEVTWDSQALPHGASVPCPHCGCQHVCDNSAFGGRSPEWAACVSKALDDPELRERFKQETGHDLDLRVDEASEDRNVRLTEWCNWVTDNIWNK